MEYRTADGHVLSDAALEAEAALLERGERPEGWGEGRTVNVTPPAWVIAAADREARRINVSRRAILNMWLAKMAEKTTARHERRGHSPAGA